MASTFAAMPSVGSFAAPNGLTMDKKLASSTNKLSSLASISGSSIGRRQSVTLHRSRSPRVNAMAKELHFNKDGSLRVEEQDYEKEKLNERIAKLCGGVAEMEATSTTTSTCLHRNYCKTSSNHHSFPSNFQTLLFNKPKVLPLVRTSLRTSEFVLHKPESSSSSSKLNDFIPNIDKTGRFCSPRAARELALMIIYAGCLEGCDLVRLFEKRMNARREPGYEFDKASLLEYNHMSFGGPPITTESVEEADELLRRDEKASAIEAEVLSAPPKLVYSKLLLRFTRKLLVAVGDMWNSHVLIIDKVAPPNWKNEAAGRILEFCILHLAMSEITVLGTRHQIVINEAVDLAKRFCDGAAPRIINGCLRTFVKDLSEKGRDLVLDTQNKVEEAQ